MDHTRLGTSGPKISRIALAWVIKHPSVSGPIVGPTKPYRLRRPTGL